MARTNVNVTRTYVTLHNCMLSEAFTSHFLVPYVVIINMAYGTKHHDLATTAKPASIFSALIPTDPLTYCQEWRIGMARLAVALETRLVFASVSMLLKW